MTHLIFLFALFFTFPDLNKRYPVYIITFFSLFLFLALRYDYGNDYMQYYSIHNLFVNGQSAWGENDILFKYLNLLIPNFYLFIAITSLFYILTIYLLIKKNLRVKDYWLSVMLLLINPYLFLVQLSSIRQTIAICFFVIAVNFAVKRKLLLFLLFILIAAGFHSSAIVLLPLYFVLNDSKIKKKWFVLITVLTAILIGTPLFDLIMTRVLVYLPLNYTAYFEQGLTGSLRATLISSVFFFIVLFNINRLDGKEIIYGKLSLIGTIISLLAIKLSMIARLGMYFEIFLILTLVQILLKIKVKAYRQLLFIIVIIIYLLRYVSFFLNPLWAEHYVIYRTILGY
ncbi:EpsG family protein [Neobacillus sp. M.A.Huq-85]